MLALDEQIDLIIPRGSNEFVRTIMHSTSIPVLGHADGICHTYVHADLDMAVRITVDSKCQYVAVCNAAETVSSRSSRLIISCQFSVAGGQGARRDHAVAE